jgi:glycosyltransferase involved in cell wall biosynthesis
LYYLPIDDWYDENTTDALKRLQAQHSFDVVIVEYVFLSKAFDAFDSSVLKILDTHDVMANRHRQYLAQGHRPAWFSTTNREESRALARAHVVLAIQEHEREHFKLLGAPDVSVVGHIIDVATASTSRLLTSVPSALFVGSTNPINLQALHWLRTEVWPLVRSRMSAILQVAGGICNELADGTDIVKLGQFGDLREAYESAHVVVNPVQTGTGLNIKSVEALGFAKPMVVTRIGARGLEAGANTAFVVAESPSEFADAIVRVLSDPSLAADLSNRSREFANRWNEAQLAQLQQVLNRKLRVA